MTLELLAGISWTPGFRGILSVLVGVVVLYGSIALILGTNSGARLGFQLALTGLAGWFFVMGFIWAIYGIGYLGPAAHWKVVDTIEGPPSAPDGARLAKARSLPLPSDLPDPVEVRNGDPALLKEFPVDAKDPLLGDVVGASEEVRDQVNEQLKGGWKVLESSNKFTGETQASSTEYLLEHGMFESASDFMFLTGFITGGETPRTDDSTVGRAVYEVVNTAKLGRHAPFYAAVQLQAVIPQETKPGQAPPRPVADEDAPIVTVVLHRDRGAQRQPSIGFTIASGLVFAVLANSLHRRDKLVDKQRAAPIGGA
ncbi:MAG: hypothetical protein H6519_08380 [Microthrixaceae bacterium]|nr:hypothetical protein [Acidimicrobiales bacterium]MCB9404438.1 hypothetical protein [Microthrixaceae bacterium]